MKIPPIPIIINLILLTAGYVYCSYALVKGMIEANDYLAGFIVESFLTFGIVFICIEVLNRRAMFILFLGITFLLLAVTLAGNSGLHFDLKLIIALSLFFITGIMFITWSISLFVDSRQPDDVCIRYGKTHKYWLYSAIGFGAGGIFFGILGNCFWEKLYKNYEPLAGKMYIIMGCLLFMSILQFLIYYILRKRKEFWESRINCPENDDE